MTTLIAGTFWYIKLDREEISRNEDGHRQLSSSKEEDEDEANSFLLEEDHLDDDLLHAHLASER